MIFFLDHLYPLLLEYQIEYFVSARFSVGGLVPCQPVRQILVRRHPSALAGLIFFLQNLVKENEDWQSCDSCLAGCSLICQQGHACKIKYYVETEQ